MTEIFAFVDNTNQFDDEFSRAEVLLPQLHARRNSATGARAAGRADGGHTGRRHQVWSDQIRRASAARRQEYADARS
jgi:hypothetical protein